MATPLHRVIIDTNTLLRGIISEASPAAKIRRAAEARRVLPLLSKPVLEEYRAVLSRPLLREQFRALTPEKVLYLIQRLKFVGEYIRKPRSRFEYPRDPLDEKFIELAIELEATHIISSDHDLLSLPTGRDEACRRFRQRLPRGTVLDAAQFVAMHVDEFGIE